MNIQWTYSDYIINICQNISACLKFNRPRLACVFCYNNRHIHWKHLMNVWWTFKLKSTWSEHIVTISECARNIQWSEHIVIVLSTLGRLSYLIHYVFFKYEWGRNGAVNWDIPVFLFLQQEASRWFRVDNSNYASYAEVVSWVTNTAQQ